MPMAGEGSRFQINGNTLPKPLIDVDGVPMFKRALTSFSEVECEKKYTIIIQKKHDLEQDLGAKVRIHLPEANLVIVEKLTRGPLETCYLASHFLNLDDAVVILDCDLWFKTPAYFDQIKKVLCKKSDLVGILTYFESNESKYSYAELKNGYVLRTAEKIAISTHALIGSYFFSSAKQFLAAAEEILAQPAKTRENEYTVSTIYNYLISHFGKVVAMPAKEYHSFGTPEEFENYKQGRGLHDESQRK